MTTATATTPSKKAVMKAELAAREIPMENGIVKLDTYEAAFRYAQSVKDSGLAPESFKDANSILVAMQHGAELGLKPLASLQHIAVINKRPTLYGKALPALILPTGLMEEFEEWIEGAGDDMVALCKAKRKGLPDAKVCRFSVADAKKAGLWGKSGPWSQYPKDMLKYKARARCLGTLFADVLCGLPVYEDVREVLTPRGKIAPDGKPDPLLEKIAPVAEGSVIDETSDTIPDGEFRDAEPDAEPVAQPEPADVPAASNEPTKEENERLDKQNRIDELLASKGPALLQAAVREVEAWLNEDDRHDCVASAGFADVSDLLSNGKDLALKNFLRAAKDKI